MYDVHKHSVHSQNFDIYIIIHIGGVAGKISSLLNRNKQTRKDSVSEAG